MTGCACSAATWSGFGSPCMYTVLLLLYVSGEYVRHNISVRSIRIILGDTLFEKSDLEPRSALGTDNRKGGEGSLPSLGIAA